VDKQLLTREWRTDSKPLFAESGGDSRVMRLAHSFDHLVGAQQCLGWNREAERMRGPEIEHRLKPGRLLSGTSAGFSD
jgi:hypothetical protein